MLTSVVTAHVVVWPNYNRPVVVETWASLWVPCFVSFKMIAALDETAYDI